MLFTSLQANSQCTATSINMIGICSWTIINGSYFTLVTNLKKNANLQLAAHCISFNGCIFGLFGIVHFLSYVRWNFAMFGDKFTLKRIASRVLLHRLSNLDAIAASCLNFKFRSLQRHSNYNSRNGSKHTMNIRKKIPWMRAALTFA